MSTLAEKIDKQFAWQQTRYATSSNLDDLFVSVDDLAGYLAAQTRADERQVRRRVKAELERRAEAGLVRRWLAVYGQSLRPERADHYFLNA